MAKYTPLSLITLNVSGLDTPSKYIDQVQHKTSFNKFKKIEISPGWCGSVDQAPACEPKGCRSDSQLGHMPRLQAQSPVDT